jgi:site-specific recombinase XerC
MRLPAALARFQTQFQADGRSPHTVAQYSRHVAVFAEWAVSLGLDDVRAVQREHVAAVCPLPSCSWH